MKRSSAARPNILIFMSDQEQADVLHPAHPCQTPHATRLAREGVSFRRAFCPSPHCCPSRASFLSGLYPSRHSIYNNVSNPTAIHRALNPGVTTFGEWLRAAGYNLAYAGKWHVSGTEDPSERGWEELFGTARKGLPQERTSAQWRELARQPRNDAPRGRGQIVRPGWGDYQLYGSHSDAGPKGYEAGGDAKIVNSALDALPRLARQRDAADVPWCLYVGANGPHDPFFVPQKFAELYDPQTIPLPPNFRDSLQDKPRVYQRMRRQFWDQLSEDEVGESIAHYWAYCTMEDTLLGEVLEALDATGQAQSTLVLRLSDHGEYAGARGLYCKGVPAFREAYHIPCIARWPAGIINPGREVDEFVTLADWAPTFGELAGAAVPQTLSGRSLAPFLRDETPRDWPDAVHTQLNGVELYYTQRSVVTKEWKYVYNGFDFDELYDLQNDPHEMVNKADKADCQMIKRDLVRRMWRFAEREDDIIFNSYAAVAFAPWGPAEVWHEA